MNVCRVKRYVKKLFSPLLSRECPSYYRGGHFKYKAQWRPMNLDAVHATPAAARRDHSDHSERERARQDVLALCAWRQSRTPPLPLCESPPRASKTASLAHIAAQSHRPPPEDCPGFVPVASIVEGVQEGVCASSGGAPSSADAATCRSRDSLSVSSSSSSGSEFFASSVGQHGEKMPERSGDDVPSNFDEPTNEEVGKWSFHRRLVHYLDGETITHSVCKVVELVILVEGGTYVRNLNPMKKPQMGELLLSKYQHLIEDIEDEHFASAVVRDDMLRGYKRAKKTLMGENLWQKLEKEMTQVNSPSQLPSGTTQLRQMKKPYIIKLWKEQNLVTICYCCLNFFLH
jgi:hypothetical protein